MTTTAIKERPILFSSPMVLAILAGQNTQTRRVVTPKPVLINGGEAEPRSWPGDDLWTWEKHHHANGKYPGVSMSTGALVRVAAELCPYGQSGDRLWVRETCCSDGWSVHYAADNDYREFGDTRYDDVIKLHHYSGGFSKQVPSIHMPRWASRIDLEITNVRVERLNQISSEDAISEGIEAFATENRLNGYWVTAFSRLWSTIHAADGPNGWDANPWVWVVEFQKVT